MTKISINDMRFYAHHGCFAEEQKIGTWFLCSVTFSYDATAAIASDNVEDALNYLTVYQLVAQQMAQPTHLIEVVASRIKQTLLDAFPQMADVTVRLSKLNPPLGGEVASVTVEY